MVVREHSFINLVFPFLFEPEKVPFLSRNEAIQSIKWRDQHVWQLKELPQEDLLPHIAQHLNSSNPFPTGIFWDMRPETLQSSSGICNRAKWMLRLSSGNRKDSFISFRIQDIELALFSTGIGFVTLTILVLSNGANDWLDFIHYSRYSYGKRMATIEIFRTVSQGIEYHFWPEPGGGLHARPNGVGSFMDIVIMLLDSCNIKGQSHRWWREVYVPGQTIPFIGLLIDDSNEAERDETLYRVRHFFHSQQEICPSNTELNGMVLPLISYAYNQWFMFSIDGGGFIAFNPPSTPFYTGTLPNHLKKQYFLLFILVLNQRFSLISLSERVASGWLRSDQKIRTELFHSIRNILLEFTARDYFSQVMQSENHHQCYLKWQETFQIDKLYREVRDEVEEMHATIEMQQFKRQEQQSRRLEMLLVGLGSFIGIPSLVMHFLVAGKEKGWSVAGYTLIGAFLLGAIILMFLHFFSRRDINKD